MGAWVGPDGEIGSSEHKAVVKTTPSQDASARTGLKAPASPAAHGVPSGKRDRWDRSCRSKSAGRGGGAHWLSTSACGNFDNGHVSNKGKESL